MRFDEKLQSIQCPNPNPYTHGGCDQKICLEYFYGVFDQSCEKSDTLVYTELHFRSWDSDVVGVVAEQRILTCTALECAVIDM